MPVGRPFLPADVEFLRVEFPLCQLQSHLRGEMSIVAPTVGDNLAVFR